MPKLLIAEDDLLIAKLYQTVCKAEGFEVTVANDGLDTWQKILSFRPDYVLLDIMMPKLNGFEVLDKIREDPSLTSMKVIALTNLSSRKICVDALAKGARLCLEKDAYKPKEIVALIRSLPDPTVPSI